jgi:hypothetical protein
MMKTARHDMNSRRARIVVIEMGFQIHSSEGGEKMMLVM